MKKERHPKIAVNHPKPIVPRPLVALFTACLVFIVLFTTFSSVLHARTTYSITDPQQRQENSAILGYLTGPVFAQNNLTFLTPAEQQHMTDVKRLYDVAYILYISAIGVLLGITSVFLWHKLWARFDELLGRSLRATGWTILILCFLFGAMVFLNFDRFWVIFHLIFFPQGNWAFPSDSVLITLYPGSFFEAFVTRWLLGILAFAVMAIICSHIMERMRHAELRFMERR